MFLRRTRELGLGVWRGGPSSSTCSTRVFPPRCAAFVSPSSPKKLLPRLLPATPYAGERGFWRPVLAFGAGCVLTASLYACLPNTAGLDAPIDQGSSHGPPSNLPTSAWRPKMRRSALVSASDLENDASLVGFPHRTSDGYDTKTLQAPSPDRLTQILRANEESVEISALQGSGVLRYDTNQIASNDPIEDDHSHAVVMAPLSTLDGTMTASSRAWMFWGVYDGHW